MTVKENIEKVRDGLEKVAFTAVGAPIAGVKALKSKTETLTRSVKDRGGDFQADVESEIRDWVAEGEALVDRMIDRIRSTNTPAQIRAAGHGAAEQVRSGVALLTSRLEETIDLVEPDIPLTEIKGVGPSTVDTLGLHGVTGVASLLDRTASDAELAKLAADTGIAEQTLRDWRTQIDLTAIDGVGDAYQRALHAIGIGTLTHLANADTGTIVDRMSGLDRPGLPSQDPSKATVSKWIQKARRLSVDDRKRTTTNSRRKK